MPLTEFEPRPSDFGTDRSSNWAITTIELQPCYGWLTKLNLENLRSRQSRQSVDSVCL